MFLSRNKKNNVCPCKPQFYYINTAFKGVKIIYMQVCFRDKLDNGPVQIQAWGRIYEEHRGKTVKSHSNIWDSGYQVILGM